MTGRRIVVGVDGSAGSLAALSWARAEVDDRGGELIEVAAPEHPAEALIAASADADLVVVGTRGKGSGTATVVGSVSRRVAAQAHCPVVVVPPSGSGGRGVVVGAAVSAAGRKALEFAFEEARLRGDGLTAVEVAGDPGLDERVVGLLAEFRERFPDLICTAQRVTGEPAEALVEAARTAALLVLGSHHSEDKWSTRLGPVPAEVLPVAPCPVAVVGQLHRVRALTEG